MPFVFQQLPSSVAPIIVSFVQNNGTLWSLASTNKSNFILTSVRRQQYYRSFCFQGAKSLLKQLHERYGKQLLKNACVSFLSTNSSIGLTDIDDILQLLDVNEKTPNGYSPFEDLLLWAPIVQNSTRADMKVITEDRKRRTVERTATGRPCRSRSW